MLTIKRYPGAIEFTVHTSKSYGTQMFALCFISFVIGATSLAIGRSPKIIITLVELSFLLSLFHIISGVNRMYPLIRMYFLRSICEWSHIVGNSELCLRCTANNASNFFIGFIFFFHLEIELTYILLDESLLVIRDLGVQTNCHSIVPWKSSSKLIPLDSIRDIFINEGFRKFDVCYYMGIAIESETEIHVVFPTLLPRHDVLQKVYKETVILLANNS